MYAANCDKEKGAEVEKLIIELWDLYRRKTDVRGEKEEYDKRTCYLLVSQRRGWFTMGVTSKM